MLTKIILVNSEYLAYKSVILNEHLYDIPGTDSAFVDLVCVQITQIMLKLLEWKVFDWNDHNCEITFGNNSYEPKIFDTIIVYIKWNHNSDITHWSH